MPGIWGWVLLVGIYGAVAGEIQKINNRYKGRDDNDPAGQPGCFTPILYVIAILGLSAFIASLFE